MMACRIAFLECTSDLWLRVAQTMQRERGWEPIYWSGAELMRADVLRRFPGVTFHENTNAVKGLPPASGPRLDLPPLDESVLASMRHAESDALIMLDRMDPDGAFDFRERRELYRRHLQFGLAMLDKLRPDIVVNAAPPHLVYDYVIYQLCRLRNIRTVVFVETVVDGIVISSPTYEVTPDQITETYRRLLESGRAATLSARTEQYWQRLAGEYSKAVAGYIVTMFTERQSGREEVPAERVVPHKMAALADRIVTRQLRVLRMPGRARIEQPGQVGGQVSTQGPFVCRCFKTAKLWFFEQYLEFGEMRRRDRMAQLAGVEAQVDAHRPFVRRYLRTAIRWLVPLYLRTARRWLLQRYYIEI